MQYRRARQKGGCYFFTVNLAERQQSILTDHIDCLRNSIRTVKQKNPFTIEAAVILPDHLHTLWTLPQNDDDFATRWMLIKANFSRQLPKNEQISISRIKKGERGIWQRRYWEHLTRDDNDFSRHVDYIHYNPVKHGHVKKAVEWPYSSIHLFIKQGVINQDWASDLSNENTHSFGEQK